MPCYEVLINIYTLVSIFFAFFFLMPLFVLAKPSSIAHPGQGVLSSKGELLFK